MTEPIHAASLEVTRQDARTRQEELRTQIIEWVSARKQMADVGALDRLNEVLKLLGLEPHKVPYTVTVHATAQMATGIAVLAPNEQEAEDRAEEVWLEMYGDTNWKIIDSSVRADEQS